ncbi:Cro/CI family transcriptional regulator [Pseudoalteromonas sp. 1181_04]|uniref:Cro/CI family transcriptional regulator n=1 Tax=Pseudoalteromonas sp. 1181_04 TaxID=2604450 RepID=UPI004063A8FC
MLRKDVIAHFGSATEVVKQLTNLSHGAVSQWEDVIPMGRAYEIQTITNGKLKVDRNLYNRKQPKSAA